MEHPYKLDDTFKETDFVHNEIIITLEEQDPVKLFDLNLQLSLQLSGQTPTQKAFFSPQSHILEEAIKEILPSVFEESISASFIPQSSVNVIYKPIFTPIALIPKLYGDGESNSILSRELLQVLTDLYGIVPPLYDISISPVSEPDTSTAFNSIKYFPDWVRKQATLNKEEQVHLYDSRFPYEFRIKENKTEIKTCAARTYLVSFSEHIPVLEAVQKAVSSTAVAHAEPNQLGVLFNDGWAKRIKFPGAECNKKDCLDDIDFSKIPDQGENVTVAIIDSGIKLEGKELKGAKPSKIRERIKPSELRKGVPENIDEMFDSLGFGYLDLIHCIQKYHCDYEVDGDGLYPDNWPHGKLRHGTHIAWIIHQRMAPKSNFIPFRGFFKVKGKREGAGTIAFASMAINVAIAMGVDVINMSFGFKKESGCLLEAMKMTIPNRMPPCMIVALGYKKFSNKVYPALYGRTHRDMVLGVGGAYLDNSCEDNEELAYSDDSNKGVEYGDFVSGPSNTVCTYKNITHTYFKVSGNSFATAFVSGLAALVIGIGKKKKSKSMTRKRVLELIRSSAKPIEGFEKKEYGKGLIDIEKTLIKANNML